METLGMGSVIAIGAAVACWLLVIAGHPVWALLAGLGGLGIGMAGLIASPGLRPGAIANLVAVVISIIGIGVVGLMFSGALV
jgi:hypothetical protein